MMGHIGIFIKGDELENYNFYCEQKYSWKDESVNN
jgi:hypothetical protein